jgi:hypothetical protein
MHRLEDVSLRRNDIAVALSPAYLRTIATLGFGTGGRHCHALAVYSTKAVTLIGVLDGSAANQDTYTSTARVVSILPDSLSIEKDSTLELYAKKSQRAPICCDEDRRERKRQPTSCDGDAAFVLTLRRNIYRVWNNFRLLLLSTQTK